VVSAVGALLIDTMDTELLMRRARDVAPEMAAVEFSICKREPHRPSDRVSPVKGGTSPGRRAVRILIARTSLPDFADGVLPLGGLPGFRDHLSQETHGDKLDAHDDHQDAAGKQRPVAQRHPLPVLEY